MRFLRKYWVFIHKAILVLTCRETITGIIVMLCILWLFGVPAEPIIVALSVMLPQLHTCA